MGQPLAVLVNKCRLVTLGGLSARNHYARWLEAANAAEDTATTTATPRSAETTLPADLALQDALLGGFSVCSVYPRSGQHPAKVCSTSLSFEDIGLFSHVSFSSNNFRSRNISLVMSSRSSG